LSRIFSQILAGVPDCRSLTVDLARSVNLSRTLAVEF